MTQQSSSAAPEPAQAPVRGAAAGDSGLRRSVFEILERGRRGEWWSRAADIFFVALILGSVAATVAASVASLQAAHGALLGKVEIFCSAAFALEYGLRIWTAPEHPLVRHLPALHARLRFARTPLMALDLMGLLPIALAMLAPSWAGTILMLRLLRILRLARYSPAIGTIGRVFAAEARPLAACAALELGLLLLTAGFMHLLERDAQPDKFGSIPDAMWWGIVTLLTVGYGDVVPVTALGKVFGGLCMILGLIFFALPIGIIATGFQQEIRRRDFLVNYAMVTRVPLFAGLDGAAIAEIVGLLKARKMPKGAIVIRKGEIGDCMYLISSGEVEVALPERTVRLAEGDCFGELALLRKAPRTATVMAASPCELMVLDAADFERLMAQNPRMAEAVDAVARARTAESRPPATPRPAAPRRRKRAAQSADRGR